MRQKERQIVCVFYDDVKAGDWAFERPTNQFSIIILFILLLLCTAFVVITNGFVNK